MADYDLSKFVPAKPAAPTSYKLPEGEFVPEQTSSPLRRVADVGIDALKGAIGLPESIVGLADIPTLGYAGKAAEAAGVRFKDAKSALDELYSPERQRANKALADTKGFLPTVGTALANPSTILGSAVESAPSMVGGAAIGRTALASLGSRVALGGESLKAAQLGAAALGEGAISAGQTAEQVRQETPTGTLTPGQVALAAGSGALTGGLNLAGGAAARKLGISDIDTALVAGKLSPGAAGPVAAAKRIGGGIVSEGILEELPQSAQEQVAQNLALGKPWNEGVPEAAAMGALVGGVMGGGANVLHGKPADQPRGEQPPAGVAPPASDAQGAPQPAPTPVSTSEAPIAPPAQPTPAAAPVQRDAAGASTHPADVAAQVAAAQPGAGPLTQAAAVAATPPPTGEQSPAEIARLNASISEAAQGRADDAQLSEMERQDQAHQVAIRQAKEAAAFAKADEIAAKNAEADRVRQQSAMEEADARVLAQRQAESTAQRRSLLDSILENADIANPVGAYTAALKRAGYQGEYAIPSAEEMNRIKRHADVRAAIEAEHVAEGTPNEMDVAALVPEKPAGAGENRRSTEKLQVVQELPDELIAAATAAKAMKKDGPTAFYQAVKKVTTDPTRRSDLMRAWKAWTPPATPPAGSPAATAAAASTASTSSPPEAPVRTPPQTVTAPVAETAPEPARQAPAAATPQVAAATVPSRVEGSPSAQSTPQESTNEAPQQVQPESAQPRTAADQGSDVGAAAVPAAPAAGVRSAGGPAVSESAPAGSALDATAQPDGRTVPAGRGDRVDVGGAVRDDALRAAHEDLIRAKAQKPPIQRRIIDGAIADAKAIREGSATFEPALVKKLRTKADAIERFDGPAAAAVRVLADHVEANRPRTPMEQARAARGVVGKSLTKEQRAKVLATLVDVYRVKNAPKESKGFDANGDERFGYAHSPDLFEKSHITGAMVRYHVTLPDGRIAHPTELFPDYTQSHIDAALAAQREAERLAESDRKDRQRRLENRKASDIADANRLFWKQQRPTNIRPEETTLLTDGAQFVRVLKVNAAKDAEVLGEAWKPYSSPQLKAQPKETRTPGQANNTFVRRWLARVGLNRDEKRDITGDTRNVGAAPGTWRDAKRHDGIGIDDWAKRLYDDGWLAAESHSERGNENQRASVEDTRDFLRRVFAGEEVHKIGDQQAEAARQDALAHDAWIEREAAMLDDALSPNELNDLVDSGLTREQNEGDFDVARELAGLPDATKESILERAGIQADNGENYEQAIRTLAAAERARAEGGESDRGFLQQQTEAELAAREEAARIKAAQDAAAAKAADQKAQADAERGDFALKGSDRAADANAGQGDMLSPVARADAIAPAPSDAIVISPTPMQDAKAKAQVADFGEKIGGARKDTARPLGPRIKASTPEDERPAWARKFHVMQILEPKPGAYPRQNVGKWQIVRETGEMRGSVAPISRDVFDTEQQAWDALPLAAVARKHRVYGYTDRGGNAQFGIFRQITDRKRALVKGGFADNDAAMRYLATHPVEILEHKFSFPERPWLDRIERVGTERRSGDVTTQMFADTFGFRGGEFGNWNMGGDGQAALNHAYDALLDFADILGVPPKALSLNGELAIAFGARGTGGKNAAAAHYEPDVVVFNLTKIKGAGSLAHEWWHAVDHYFARSAGDKRSASVVASGHRFDTTARPEVVKAIKDIVDAMMYAKKSTTTDADLYRQRAAKRLTQAQEQIDYRLNELRKPYSPKRPFTEAELKQWDALAARLREGDVGPEVYIAPSSKHAQMGYTSTEVIRDMNAIYKAATGRSFLRADPASRGRELYWYAKAVADNKANMAVREDVTTEVKGRSDYYIEARRIDEYRTGDYWSTPEEMGARAFESYIFDKLTENEQRSDYLVYAVENRYYAAMDMRPYPEGDERARINDAFAKLFDTLEAKQTEKGVALGNTAAGRISPDDSLSRLDHDLFGQLLAGPTTVKPLLAMIATRSTSKLNRAVAGLLLRAGVKAKVKLGSPEGLQFAGGAAADEFTAAYVPSANEIRIFKPTRPEQDIIHEAMHEAVYAAIRKGGLAARQMQALFEHVKKSGKIDDSVYGLQDLDEFVSEAFSNPEFQNMLRKVNSASGIGQIKTAWDWFVNIVRGVLGLPASEHNALSQALEIGQALVAEGVEARSAGAPATALGNRHDVRGPDGRFHPHVSPAALTTATFNGAKDLIKSIARSDRVLNRVISKFNTPYHLAQVHPEFKPVFDEAQNFNHDISFYTKGAADLAPDLLVSIESMRDFKKKAPSNPDVKAISDAIYAGTLYAGGSPLEGKRWSDAELRSGRDAETDLPVFAPLNDQQVKLYHQALAAVESALNENAKSMVSRLARLRGMDLNRDGSLDQMVAVAKEQADQDIAERNTAHAAELDRIREQIAALTPRDLELDSGAKTKFEKRLASREEQHAAALAEIEGFKKSLDDIQSKTDGLIEHGYFPAMRFGPYALLAESVDKDGKRETLAFSRFETQMAANLAKREWAKEFPNAELTSSVMNDDAYRLFQGLNLDALELFAEHMVDDKGQPITRDPVMQEYFRVAASERSTLKRQIRRKGTAGYSGDIPRALAQFVVSQATSTSRNYHAAEMLKHVRDIKAGDLQQYATRYVTYLQDPKEEVPGLRGLLANYYILGSLAFGAVNMTQPVMMSAPYLTQFTGWTNAMAQLGKAAKDVVTGRKGLTAAERAAYDKAAAAGVVSPQEIHQIRADSQASMLGDNPVWQKMEAIAAAKGVKLPGKLALRKAAFLWGSIYSLTEQFNRGTTFLGAYRIGVGKGEADPYAFAVKAVEETQGVYNRGNRVAASRSAVGSIVFTFKQFSIAYLELAKRLYSSDKKAFAVLMLTLMAGAGTGGLPFADDLSDLIDTIGQWMGFATNTKKSVRQWAENTLGHDVANIMQYGVSGIPGVPIDVANRVGMHNIIPGTALLKTAEPDKAKDIIDVLGPAAALFKNVGNAVEGLATGKPGELVSLLPMALQNAAQGGSMLESGVYRDKMGRKVMDVDALDSAFKLIGFQPNKVAQESRIIAQNQQDKDLQKVMESSIVGRLAQAAVERDPAIREQALRDLATWNQTNPELRIAITPQQIAQRTRGMIETREQRTIRTTSPELRGAVAADLRR